MLISDVKLFLNNGYLPVSARAAEHYSLTVFRPTGGRQSFIDTCKLAWNKNMERLFLFLISFNSNHHHLKTIHPIVDISLITTKVNLIEEKSEDTKHIY